ncbi:hypothetical protein RR48_01721 [Papilio machaon]|uniref:Uncharacterized protein n=1 Tax=Papilio machaon TaxID=76193 RepID=A0A0N1I8Z1_PAPMA|nr:hypothetical protein RR48_01721 [Papilio machaon]
MSMGNGRLAISANSGGRLLDSTESSSPPYSGGFNGPDSGAPSPDACHYQPAAQRFRFNEQSQTDGIKLLTSINQIVQQRADLENNRATLSGLLEELKRKLKRRVEECHLEKKEKMKALKNANQRLEKEKFSIISEIEHLKRHLEREEAHHVQHARNAVAQRKRQAENDIIRLRKELSSTKSSVAALRIAPQPARKTCSRFV